MEISNGSLFVADQRKVVVIFFGDNCHDWVYAHDTLDFEKHQAEKEQAARVLDEAGPLSGSP